MTLPSDAHIEAAHLNLQINQERAQSQVFTIVGHISAVDPTTNQIKVVIPSWTNDNQTYTESNWIPLGTAVAGNQFGIQLLPFGQATVTDPTAQSAKENGNTPQTEQVLVHVLGTKRGLYIQSVQMFNKVDVPPSGYQDISGVQASPGEWLWKHSAGGYLYFNNNNVIILESLTNPAPVVQTDQTVTSCTQNIAIKATAIGTNTNKNGDTTESSTSTIELISDASGSSATTTANLNLTSQTPNAESDAENTTNFAANSTVTNGSIGNANLDLKASSKGADIDNAEFTLAAETESKGIASGTINIDAGEIGNSTLDINVIGLTSTLNINVDGVTNVMNVTVLDGIINVITDIVNVDCLEANVTAATSTTLNTGILEATCSGSATITAPLATVESPVVTLGNSAGAKRLLNDVAAQIYNIHTHTAPGGETGPPSEIISPELECINVFGS